MVLVVDTNAISDVDLFYGTKHFINSDSSYAVYGWPVLGESKEIDFYFFNADSVYKFIKKNDQSSISKKCFLKGYRLAAGKITNSDTLFYLQD